MYATVAVAFFTRFFNFLTATVTMRTSRFGNEESALLANTPCTMASCAGFYFRIFFRAAAVAVFTLGKSIDLYIFFRSAYGFFQCDFNIITQIFAAYYALTTAPTTENIAEHIAENVAEICTAEATETTRAGTAVFKCRMTELIISGTFFFIGKHFIGFVDFFEFFFAFFITLSSIRVIFHCKAFISTFDFFFIRAFLNA